MGKVSQLCIHNEEFTLKLYVKFVLNSGLELGKLCDVCCFLLNGWHFTDCIRDTDLLPLRVSSVHVQQTRKLKSCELPHSY